MRKEQYYHFSSVFDHNDILELLEGEKCYYYYNGVKTFWYIAQNLSTDSLLLLKLKGIDVEDIDANWFDWLYRYG